jgi:hypothetical protein
MAAKKAAGSRRARARASTRGLHLKNVKRELNRVHKAVRAYRKKLPPAQRGDLDSKIEVIVEMKRLAQQCFIPPIIPRTRGRAKGRGR